MVADVRRIYALPTDVRRLLVLSTAEGFDFVERLVADWDDSSNRFDRPGEVLVECRSAGFLVGIGGLNIDPYIDDPSVGRLRHVYVDPAQRGRGIGREIVDRLIALARGRFDRVRLRVGTPHGGAFYMALGFSVTDEPDATHTISL
jgi:GNAT superfamily N-acetyltransferase